MTTHAIRRQPEARRLFGVPLGDFGPFVSLLASFAFGLMAFCVASFFSIFGILIYDKGFGHNLDFADSYRYVALPVGLIVLALSLAILLGMWARRKLIGK